MVRFAAVTVVTVALSAWSAAPGCRELCLADLRCNPPSAKEPTGDCAVSCGTKTAPLQAVGKRGWTCASEKDCGRMQKCIDVNLKLAFADNPDVIGPGRKTRLFPSGFPQPRGAVRVPDSLEGMVEVLFDAPAEKAEKVLTETLERSGWSFEPLLRNGAEVSFSARKGDREVQGRLDCFATFSVLAVVPEEPPAASAPSGKAPSVRVDDVRVMGSMDAFEVRASLDRGTGELGTCGVSGIAKVKVVVGSDGKPSTANVQLGTPNPERQQCVEAVLKRLRFPSLPHGGVAIVQATVTIQ